jgi:hypothetical protein
MSLETLQNILKAIPFDLRAEVVIADLAKNGFDVDDLFVRPVGIFKRKFGKDISKIEQIENKHGANYLVLNVNREGLYDVLPQTLFHNPARKPKPFKSATEMVKEVRERIKEEQNARDFFFAYEIEFFKQRISVEWHEQNALDTITYSMNDETFLNYWELPSYFNSRQKGILFYLLPVFHNIRGRLGIMQETYKTILMNDVIIRNIGLNSENLEFFHPHNILGDTRLSIKSILGSRADAIFDTIQVEIINLPAEKIFEYLPGGINRRVIKHLNSLFMPLHAETHLKISPQKNKWIISPKDKNTSRLGYSTST